MTVAPAQETLRVRSGDVPEVAHIVGWWQHIRDLLGFIPVPLCGAPLICDRCTASDASACTCVGPGSPVCPLCILAEGRQP